MTSRHRLTDLLGMGVVFADGRDGDQVIDVRLAPSTRVIGPLAELVVVGLLVGRMRPGTLFGYERHPTQGPWVIKQIVRLLHRHTHYVRWADVDTLDWEARVVRLRVNHLQQLSELDQTTS